MIEKREKKLMKIIKILSAIFIVLFFGFIIYAIIFGDGHDHFEIVFPIGFTFIVGFTLFIIIYALRAGKAYRKDLMEYKPKNRIRYIDTFYYLREARTGDTDYTTSWDYCIYHILEDINTKKIYAIAQQNTNLLFQKILNDTKVLRNDKINGFSTRKNWKEANYNDEGNLWIDEEIKDAFINDGDTVTIEYMGEKNKLKVEDELFNRNTSNNVSLLEKATFITGFAQLDDK